MPLTESNTRPGGTHFLIKVAALIIIIAGMRAAEPILVPFFLAVFISVICTPPLFWLKNKGVPTVLSVIVIVTGILILGLIITALVGTSVNSFSQSLPAYQESLHKKTQAVIAWLGSRGMSDYDQVLLDTINPGSAMKLAAGFLNELSGVLKNTFLILFTVIFILFEESKLLPKLRLICADSEKSQDFLNSFMSTIQRYMTIKTLFSLATGIVITIWLVILGVDFPLLWGLLAFMLNYVPNIGSIIAAVPAVLLALIQLGTGTALFAALGYVVVNVVMGSVLEPRFMGRHLGLSTLVVFLSLIFWGWVLGPVGMLLSIPLTMTVKIALDSNKDTQWIAVLLGSEGSAVRSEADVPKGGENNNIGTGSSGKEE